MDDLVLEGAVVAETTGGGQHFSKSLRDGITMVKGLGIKGDAHAGAHVWHRHLPGRNLYSA